MCWEFKQFPEIDRKCSYCRNKAIQKAVSTGMPFAGFCCNGIWEYIHPVVIDGVVVCIIFIGNILEEKSGERKILHQLSKLPLSGNPLLLLDTMEKNCSPEQYENYALLIESYIQLIYKYAPAADLQQDVKSYIKDILFFVDENINGDITLSKLSGIFHYNEKYLGRQFKKATGMSLDLYICKRRVERAVDLLQNTDNSITDIAYRSGFDTITYFNRRFRQFIGMSPTEYRKTLQRTDS